MIYNEYYNEQVARPKSSKDEFIKTSQKCFDRFADNSFFNKIFSNSLKIEDYHTLLCNLFYQVYHSSNSFSLAAANCSWNEKKMRDYLILHAEEEKKHWCWILEDLKSTNFSGDPRQHYPNHNATAYFSYAHYLANSKPILRLAMAYFLEGLSAKNGVKIGLKACEILKITKKQASFFIQHGELDSGHSDDVLNVIESTDIDEALWGEMSNVILCTSELYRNLYNF